MNEVFPKKYYKNDEQLNEYFDSLPMELKENILMTGVKLQNADDIKTVAENKKQS